MAPSLTFGLLLVVLVLVAGCAELYAHRRRSAELRERFRHEFAGPGRDYERLQRARSILEARQQRIEGMGGVAPKPMAVPVLVRDQRE